MICRAWKPFAIGSLLCLCWAVGGCSSTFFRGKNSQSSDLAEMVEEDRFQGLRLVGDMAVPVGTNYQRLESVGLVTRLKETGSDPPPSPLRDQLKRELQTHQVPEPEEMIGSKKTAMVIVSGLVPPGAVKGDTIDVEVVRADRTETTSLRGGWLMASRMRETAIVENELHTGHVAALAQGPIVVDALFDRGGDEVLLNRGRVLTGGIVQLDRAMGLSIRSEHTSVKTSSAIGAAINERFHDYDHGSKKGLANPTRDDYLELKIHSRYRHFYGRYIEVIRNIAVGESPVERIARLAQLEKQLLEPTTSQLAAIQLEAIGKESIQPLRKGLTSLDNEVRFYAAEALAYLEDVDAVPELYVAARDERAFRWRAMHALAILDQYTAQEALLELLNSTSAETRYGAFCALRSHNPRDPSIRGEIIEDQFALHSLATSGSPMIHIARSKRPELVFFGHGQRLESPDYLFAGEQILVKRQNENSVKISRFEAGDNDRHLVTSTNLEEILKAVVQLGGGYAEAVQMLEEAKSKGYLAARLEIDATPRLGRAYRRGDVEATGSDAEESGNSVDGHGAESIPDIFVDRLSRERTVSTKPKVIPDINEPVRTEGGFLDRMTRWMIE